MVLALNTPLSIVSSLKDFYGSAFTISKFPGRFRDEYCFHVSGPKDVLSALAVDHFPSSRIMSRFNLDLESEAEIICVRSDMIAGDFPVQAQLFVDEEEVSRIDYASKNRSEIFISLGGSPSDLNLCFHAGSDTRVGRATLNGVSNGSVFLNKTMLVGNEYGFKQHCLSLTDGSISLLDPVHVSVRLLDVEESFSFIPAHFGYLRTFSIQPFPSESADELCAVFQHRPGSTVNARLINSHELQALVIPDDGAQVICTTSTDKVDARMETSVLATDLKISSSGNLYTTAVPNGKVPTFLNLCAVAKQLSVPIRSELRIEVDVSGSGSNFVPVDPQRILSFTEDLHSHACIIVNAEETAAYRLVALHHWEGSNASYSVIVPRHFKTKRYEEYRQNVAVLEDDHVSVVSVRM